MRLFRLSMFVLSLFFVSSSYAQSVGLVLSGGGAKGLYHIGIIKALEENGVPIDYISGTSMGSIVAGLYAAGYSPEEMEVVFNSPEVLNWVSGKIDDKYHYYYKKQTPNSSMISVNFGFGRAHDNKMDPITDTLKKRKITFSLKGTNEGMPSMSLINSTSLDMAMLDFFAAPTAYCGGDFDKLFVPFRCISTNIYDKKQYLWSSGDIGQAIRSSMAIPLVFSPVAVDSMLMYDGGLVNNYPWRETMEEFSPDILIGGICVSGKPDISTIAGQIEMLTTQKTDYNIPDSIGITISRDMDVGTMDFKKSQYIIRRGYEDALAAMPTILECIKRRVPKEEIEKRRASFRDSLPELVIDGLEINGLTRGQNYYVKTQLTDRDHDGKDAKLTIDEFKDDYFKIMSDGVLVVGFPVAKYNDSTGTFKVKVDMHNKPDFKAMIGVNISSASTNMAYLGFQYHDIGRVGTTYTLDGNIGTYYSAVQLASRYNFYGGRTPFYIENALSYNFYDYSRGNSQSITYQRTQKYYRYNNFYFSSLIGTPVQRSSKLEFRLALGRDRHSYSFDPEQVFIDNSNINYFTSNLSLKRNSLNYSLYPTRGLYQNISIFGTFQRERSFYMDDYPNPEYAEFTTRGFWGGAMFSRDDYFELSKHFNIAYSVEALYSNTLEYSNKYIENMMAPAFTPTPHSKTIYLPEFRNNSYIAVGLKPIFKLNENLYLKTSAYCFKGDLESWKHLGSSLKYIVDASAVYQSPIGPVSLSYSYYTVKSMKRSYLTFSIGYMLFKPKGIVF